MNLGLVFVLLVSSVVLASGSSCEKNVNVTVQNPKYLKFGGGFFFIHGLTNGESVVMYKTSVGKKVKVQYIFINDDCLYEIKRYNIIANGSFVDHVKLLKKPEEFSFRKTLSLTVDGKAVEIKIKINPTGFVLNQVKGIETFKPQRKEVEDVCNRGSTTNKVSIFKLLDKKRIEFNYMNNGRFFHQCFRGSYPLVGKYAFKISSGDYYTFDYDIYAFKGDAVMKRNSYYVMNSDNFSENIDIFGYSGMLSNTKSLKFCFKSTGVLILKDSHIIEYVQSPGGQKPTNSDSRPW